MKTGKFLLNFKKKFFKSNNIPSADVCLMENKEEEVSIKGKTAVNTVIAFSKFLKHGSIFLIEILSYHPDIRKLGIQNLYKCGNDIAEFIINLFNTVSFSCKDLFQFFKFSGLAGYNGLFSKENHFSCLQEEKFDPYIMSKDMDINLMSDTLKDHAHIVSINGDSSNIVS